MDGIISYNNNNNKDTNFNIKLSYVVGQYFFFVTSLGQGIFFATYAVMLLASWVGRLPAMYVGVVFFYGCSVMGM